MILGIMQPYFFPYIGYFQLMNAVDEFIIYNNIQYTKKGWINRNRILVNGKDEYITLPLKKDSDYLNVNERYLAESWNKDRIKLLNRIESSYRKAPYFKIVFPIIEDCLSVPFSNLFAFLFDTIKIIRNYLEIETLIKVSSFISIDHSLKSEDKVIALCKASKADSYINGIGGIELYNRDTFKQNNIDLYFIKANEIVYNQFDNNFISSLSIIDVMMFNSKEQIKEMLKEYTLL